MKLKLYQDGKLHNLYVTFDKLFEEGGQWWFTASVEHTPAYLAYRICDHACGGYNLGTSKLRFRYSDGKQHWDFYGWIEAFPNGEWGIGKHMRIRIAYEPVKVEPT